MPKLIILGGGNCQRNAFCLAKERGIQTVLFDQNENTPAAALADGFVKVSTFDKSGCLAAARAVGADGIMTLGTDQPVLTAAYVANALSLPTLISPFVALAVTNKALMKKILTQSGIPTVPYSLADEASLRALGETGPLVIKPFDNQGQKGVFRCETGREAAALFPAAIGFSRCKKLLCEAFYPSKEITVSAWVCGNIAHILTVTDRITFENGRHIGVCAAHRFPATFAEGVEAEIEAITARVAAAFMIPDGPLYIQLLRGENGLVVNELACRIGGAFEDVFIPYLTGFPILPTVMDCALGKKAPAAISKTDPLTKQARVLMPFGRPGRLERLTPLEEIRALPFVLHALYNFEAGACLPPFENSGARLGSAVLCGEDSQKMQENLRIFQNTFQALDDTGASMLLPTPPVA